jgi:hypothetical protein
MGCRGTYIRIEPLSAGSSGLATSPADWTDRLTLDVSETCPFQERLDESEHRGELTEHDNASSRVFLSDFLEFVHELSYFGRVREFVAIHLLSTIDTEARMVLGWPLDLEADLAGSAFSRAYTESTQETS